MCFSTTEGRCLSPWPAALPDPLHTHSTTRACTGLSEAQLHAWDICTFGRGKGEHLTQHTLVSIAPLPLSHSGTEPLSKEGSQRTAAYHLFPKSWRRGSWKDAEGHTCCTPSLPTGWIPQHELIRSKATASWVLLLKSVPFVLGWAEEMQLCFNCGLGAILLKEQINELANCSAL